MSAQKCSTAVSVFLFVACLVLVFPESAHAGYIDSGSGSSLVQVIVAAAAAVGKLWHSFCRAVGVRK